mgnify:CR=1 FL=1
MQAVLRAPTCLLCVIPHFWLVTTSLRTPAVALQSPPAWLFLPTLSNYTEVLFVDRPIHAILPGCPRR